MPLACPAETVRRIKIEIGEETHAVDFSKEIPHAAAMERARQILATFDRKPDNRDAWAAYLKEQSNAG